MRSHNYLSINLLLILFLIISQPVNLEALTLSCPIRVSYTISLGYGDDCPGCPLGWHTGIDYDVPQGTAVYAAAGGTVRDINVNCDTKEKGSCVWIDIGNNLYTSYQHLGSYVVAINQTISQGQLIGYVSSYASSLGNPHLHFEMEQDLHYGNYVNPNSYGICNGGLPPSCPDLYSWNGEEYENNDHIFTECHCPESESYQEMILTQTVVAQNNTLTFKIKELDGEISYINSIDMYYRNNGNVWTELDLISAVHNTAGDVREALKDKDDERVYTVPGDEILLTYLAPSGGVEGAEFKSISSGYYLWSAETWCEVLELGPDLNIHPGDTVTFSAKINNMSAYELPEDAVVYFNIHGPELSAANVVSVSSAGLAPGSPKWFFCNWTVPDDFPGGDFPYKASVYIGETDITWKATDQSNASGDEREVTRVGSSCN